MCNNCHIALEECILPQKPYVTLKSWSSSGFSCDGCDDLFGSFRCPTTVSCKRLFHKETALFSHAKACLTYEPEETENHWGHEDNILDFNSKDCLKEFGELGQLKRHMTMFHGDKQNMTDISKVCNVCKRIFTVRESLKRHMILH